MDREQQIWEKLGHVEATCAHIAESLDDLAERLITADNDLLTRIGSLERSRAWVTGGFATILAALSAVFTYFRTFNKEG